VWKPGPAYPATVAVPYPDLLSPWVPDPGRGAERLSERLSERLFGMGPAAGKRIWICVLRDVAWGEKKG
jgi:hypothetical protein